eukprot:15883103-Heterocapsa_arctica.AAC.1
MSWSPGSLGRCCFHFVSWALFQTSWFSGLRFPGLASIFPQQGDFARALMFAFPVALVSQR